MSKPRFSHGAHHRQIPGPALDQPFRVLRGTIAVVGQLGERYSVLLLQHAIWPGIRAFADEELELFSPTETLTTAEVSYTDGVEAGEILAAKAFVMAQVIRFQSGDMKLEALDRYFPVEKVNRTFLGACLAAARETASKLIIERVT